MVTAQHICLYSICKHSIIIVVHWQASSHVLYTRSVTGIIIHYGLGVSHDSLTYVS